MPVYTFCHTNNIDCNINPGSDICVSVDREKHLKLRSCCTTWITSQIQSVKTNTYIVRVYTTNSNYSIMCKNNKEAHELAEAILDQIA